MISADKKTFPLHLVKGEEEMQQSPVHVIDQVTEYRKIWKERGTTDGKVHFFWLLEDTTKDLVLLIRKKEQIQFKYTSQNQNDDPSKQC